MWQLPASFQTIGTTKPSYFYEGFVLYGAGTRRTVCFWEARFSADLEVGGKFCVPQLVTINKSASYGFQWNRIRVLSQSYTTSLGYRLSLANRQSWNKSSGGLSGVLVPLHREVAYGSYQFYGSLECIGNLVIPPF